jgi:prevent-host-death family protein
MIQGISSVRITESELSRDIHGVLEKVQQGVEVIVEQNNRPIAVIRPPAAPGRKISECIVLARAHEENLGYRPVPDLLIGITAVHFGYAIGTRNERHFRAIPDLKIVSL